ncbi:hypothetical protein, partial [Salinivibrio sp. EAGSL]|uniref:hypothetical protein n=1 Tax=Salinivibrio sp. EAGSL TaxID=2738468 RepID=UPI001C37DA56
MALVSDGARPAWVFMIYIVLALMPTYANGAIGAIGAIGVCPIYARFEILNMGKSEKQCLGPRILGPRNFI